MILGRLKAWAIAIGAALVTVLAFLLRIAHLKSQRDQAQHEAEQEGDARVAVERTRDQEQAVHDAQQQARNEAEDVNREALEQRHQGKRPEAFGDPRLRRK